MLYGFIIAEYIADYKAFGLNLRSGFAGKSPPLRASGERRGGVRKSSMIFYKFMTKGAKRRPGDVL